MFSQIHKDITGLLRWLSKYIRWLIIVLFIGIILLFLINNLETIWTWAVGICVVGLGLWFLEAIITFLYSFKEKNTLKERELELKEKELQIKERELNRTK